MELYQAALFYRSWGWSVFPIYQKKPSILAFTYEGGESGGPYEHWPHGWRPHRPRKGGHRVRVTGWKRFQTRRPSDGLIRQMFDGKNGMRVDGLAAVVGPVSGNLCVRDFDTVDSYLEWAEAQPSLARRLPTARTRRGAHVFFRLSPSFPPVFKKWSDGELLGDGRHYVVLPPSKHPSGCQYGWVNEPSTPEDLPILDPGQAGLLKMGRGWVHTPASFTPASIPNPKPSPGDSYTPRQNIPLEIVERELVLGCVPTGPGQRNDCLWRMARGLKALPHLADASDEQLRPFVEQWYQVALPVIETKSFKNCWADFRRQFRAVQVPLGHEFALEEAMARALTGPPPAEADQYADGPTHNLVCACAALQGYAGDGPFYLSWRAAQRVCGYTTHRKAGSGLRALVEAGLLELVERGSAGTNRRRASRYRWVGEAGRSPGGDRAVEVRLYAALGSPGNPLVREIVAVARATAPGCSTKAQKEAFLAR